MPTIKPRYIFNIKDFGDVAPESLSEAANEVADYLEAEVLAYVADGKSPVKGQGNFKQLSKKYAEEVHGGDRTPRLEDTGDMLDGFSVLGKSNGEIDIFVVGGFENDKASGHNQFPGGEHPFLPVRRFIPFGGDGETFRPEIISGIKDILDNYAPAPVQDVEDITEIFSRKEPISNLNAEQEAQAREILRSFADFFPDE